MKNYKKVYLDALGLDETSFVASEISGEKAIDIHHIIGRGKLGKDIIENLMALTREEHIEFGDRKCYMVLLLKIHRQFLRNNKVAFSEEYFNEMIRKYED